MIRYFLSVIDADAENIDPERKETFQRYVDDDRVAGVTIHRTDKLRANFFIMHPVVKVHIVDGKTGKHLIKQDK